MRLADDCKLDPWSGRPRIQWGHHFRSARRCYWESAPITLTWAFPSQVQQTEISVQDALLASQKGFGCVFHQEVEEAYRIDTDFTKDVGQSRGCMQHNGCSVRDEDLLPTGIARFSKSRERESSIHSLGVRRQRRRNIVAAAIFELPSPSASLVMARCPVVTMVVSYLIANDPSGTIDECV